MVVLLPNLAGAAWLSDPVVLRIFAALNVEGDEARVIGGAVRNAVMGLPVGDIDFGTTATPDIVTRRAEAAGLKVVPTGLDHGTLTLVGGGTGYQVTTLREDVETDGRHAVVRFGRDWEADARRRDFTVNALSVDAGGTVHDPLGGYTDILAGRIRFIGEPDRRIAEDRLRILRFFRIHAEYGRGPIDAEGLSAAIRARNGVRELSAERVGQEMRRLLVAARAAEMAEIMQESGILSIVLAGVGFIPALRRLAAFEVAKGAAPSPALRLAALGCRIEEDVARLSQRLRLTNAERDRMLAALVAASSLARQASERGARRALYRFGPVAYRDGVALAFAWGEGVAEDVPWRDLHALSGRWRAPAFPLGGGDVLDKGQRGPAVGALLRAIEAWWIEQDFQPDEAALRSRLQQMIAAQQ
jgi:poly(A) polymerase